MNRQGVVTNYQAIKSVKQRLFGMDADESDRGVLVEMDDKLDRLEDQQRAVYEKLREMNGEQPHRRPDGGSPFDDAEGGS